MNFHPGQQEDVFQKSRICLQGHNEGSMHTVCCESKMAKETLLWERECDGYLWHVRELGEDVGNQEKFGCYLGLKFTQNKKFQRKISKETKCARKIIIIIGNIRHIYE